MTLFINNRHVGFATIIEPTLLRSSSPKMPLFITILPTNS